MGESKRACPACGNAMRPSRGPFGYVRDGASFVIEDVERLECPMCHEMSFTVEQSKALHARRDEALKV